MSETNMAAAAARPVHRAAPWHLWLAGTLSLLWNAAGAYTIAMGQMGRLQGISAEEALYYATQPPWHVALTDVALATAVFGALGLLLRSRRAVMLFVVSLAAILVTHAYDLAAGTSMALSSRGAMIASTAIAILAVLQLMYALTMQKRGVLR